jgi:transcriptional regulator with XRE-family HTH domain
MIAINEKLRFYRLSCGLSQEAVAKEIGIKRTTVTAIENGDRKILAEELIDFSKIYGIPVETLLNDDCEDETITLIRGFKKLSEDDKQDVLHLIRNKNEFQEFAF